MNISPIFFPILGLALSRGGLTFLFKLWLPCSERAGWRCFLGGGGDGDNGRGGGKEARGARGGGNGCVGVRAGGRDTDGDGINCGSRGGGDSGNRDGGGITFC